MRAIVTSQGERRWISGLFQAPEAARACFDELPVGASAQHAIVNVLVETYPVFVIEDRSGFAFLDREKADEVLRLMADPPENGEPILFMFRTDYRPLVPGRDELGRVWHVHLGAAELARVRLSGLAAICPA
jgi:hypothetical protein